MRARGLVLALALLALASVAQADCASDLAATAEYGSLLRTQQEALQREVAVLRSQVVACEQARAKLDKEKQDLEKKAAPTKAPASPPSEKK